MRRATTLTLGALLAAGLAAGPAAAMTPPEHTPAADRFGCVDGERDPVGGHPGSQGGLADATARIAGQDHNPTQGHPTAWNAEQHAGPIELGDC